MLKQKPLQTCVKLTLLCPVYYAELKITIMRFRMFAGMLLIMVLSLGTGFKSSAAPGKGYGHNHRYSRCAPRQRAAVYVNSPRVVVVNRGYHGGHYRHRGHGPIAYRSYGHTGRRAHYRR